MIKFDSIKIMLEIVLSRNYSMNNQREIISYLDGREIFSLDYFKDLACIFRCGYLIYSQEDAQKDLENGKNYQDLLRVITTAVKNKRRCQGLCS